MALSRPRDPPADLDAIDGPGLCLVEDLQRRVTTIEEDGVAAIVFKGGQLLQTERVSEEGGRAIKILHGQDDSEFRDGHVDSTLLSGAPPRHRSLDARQDVDTLKRARRRQQVPGGSPP